MSFLELRGISKTYRGAASPTVDKLDLAVDKGELVVILGSSGCGKTTTLKLVAGLEHQNAGSIIIDGELMNGRAAEKRPIAMVFQKSLLFKNMTVAENINFSARLNRRMSRPQLQRRTNELLEVMQLDGLGRRRVNELSGGQEQRVSLARALMAEPKVLLLDEPLSALDASLRVSLREYIRVLNREFGATMLFVTHDQSEAVALADRIAVMFDGRIAQAGAPDDFYSRPRTRQIAEFFGWRNFVSVGLARERLALGSGAGANVAVDAGARAGTSLVAGVGNLMAESGASIASILAIRPESAINIGTGALHAVVIAAQYQGMSMAYNVDCAGIPLELVTDARYRFAVGETMSFDLDVSLTAIVKDC